MRAQKQWPWRDSTIGAWGGPGWTARYSAGLSEEAGELDADELEGGVGVVQAGAEELGVLGGCGLQRGEPLVQRQDGCLPARCSPRFGDIPDSRVHRAGQQDRRRYRP